jgi:hypothetical protein
VKIVFGGFVLVLISLVVQIASAQDDQAKRAGGKEEISFQADIFPVMKKNCLPCLDLRANLQDDLNLA